MIEEVPFLALKCQSNFDVEILILIHTWLVPNQHVRFAMILEPKKLICNFFSFSLF